MDIRITVVEDEEHFAKHLVRCLEEWSRKAEWNVKIEQYGGAEPLLVRLDSDMLDDVYILDVEMPYMNGIQLAQCIRRKDPDAYIVFLTAHEEWALQGYDVQACGYVLKEKYSDKLQRILQEIIEKLKWEEKDVYAICYDRKWKKIRQSDIIYLEKNGKNTVFHCKKNGLPGAEVVTGCCKGVVTGTLCADQPWAGSESGTGSEHGWRNAVCEQRGETGC